MPAQVLDGRETARCIREELKKEVDRLQRDLRVTPGLAVILVGDDPASHLYVRNKAVACQEVGIKMDQYLLPRETREEVVLELIERLNMDKAIHGILVQLPLPPQIDDKRVFEAVLPNKDVDGFHPVNLGGLLVGNPIFISCTPIGILELLDKAGVEIEGRHGVVVGWSVIVGKPLVSLLLQRRATVTVCQVWTRDLASHTRQADILVVAAGSPGLITAPMVKEGAVVIDVGLNRLEDGRIVGDVDFQGVAEKASLITPVPGGVGPMTVAMLLRNTLKACKRACVA